jgi:hypothetical protein
VRAAVALLPATSFPRVPGRRLRTLPGEPRTRIARASSATSRRDRVRAARPLFHGGVSGLEPDEILLQPAVTRIRSCADIDSQQSRPDRIYLARDPKERDCARGPRWAALSVRTAALVGL